MAVNGTTLEITFTDEPNTIGPANTVFRVKVDSDTGVTPSAVSIAGSRTTTASHTLSGLTNNLLCTLEAGAATGGSGRRTIRGPLAAPANLAATSG